MRGMPRHWGAILALALPGLPVFAQAPTPAPPSTPLSPPLTAPVAKAPTVSPTAVAATVNGEPISELAVQRGLERVIPAKREQVRPELLNVLIDNVLIEQHLKQTGVAIEKAEVDKRVAEMRQALKDGKEDFEKLLVKLKVTESELREHIIADLRWIKYATGQANDKVLRELFTSDKDMFDGSMVKARHILLTPPANDAKAAAAATEQLIGYKKQVEATVTAGLAKLPATTTALERAKARANLIGEAFAALAKEKSECPTKQHGGEVGWFQKAGHMVAPFSQAAFSLQPNQMSEVVKTQFGMHLILVTERKPGREVKFEDIKEAVKEMYCDRLRDALATQVRARSRVIINPVPR